MTYKELLIQPLPIQRGEEHLAKQEVFFELSNLENAIKLSWFLSRYAALQSSTCCFMVVQMLLLGGTGVTSRDHKAASLGLHRTGDVLSANWTFDALASGVFI